MLALGTAAYLLARPGLALLHELLVMATASVLGGLAVLGAAVSLSGRMPFDPVYTGTMFLLLSNVRVAGVAVMPPVGASLHQIWPAIFAPSELIAEGAWVSAVVEPGSSFLARGLAGLGADVALLVLGLLLVQVGVAARRVSGLSQPGTIGRGRSNGEQRGGRSCRFRWLAVFGALLQAGVVVDHLADQPPSLADLEATGLTYGFSVLFSGPAAERPRLTSLLALPPDALRDVLLVLSVAMLAYVLALALVFGPVVAWRLGLSLVRLRLWSARVRLSVSYRRRLRLQFAQFALAAFALLVAASPLGSLAEANSRYLEDPLEADLAAEWAQSGSAALPAAPLPPLAPGSSLEPSPASAQAEAAGGRAARGGRVPVAVVGSNFSYGYRVNGARQVIRGMGYNPTYARLPAAERAVLYDRDFAAMRQAGVNTVLGWVTEEFDGLLLDKAQEHGLGVILPYDLSPDLDYTSATIREAVARDVRRWVGHYKEHPALRLWGLGNEVLHKLVYPSWMKLRGDPVLEARAEAFSSFYVELIDEIHRIDPDHPVTYRDAEDLYLPHLRTALNRAGVARPWFVYGINSYTHRLSEIIANWPNQGLDAALLISEFGPGGSGPGERPRGYREMWAIIRAQPGRVLGGAPYVWTTDGPEEVDRIFGLVDANGNPVDGSLAAIGRLFRGQTAGSLQVGFEPAAGPEVCDQRVAALARGLIEGLRIDPMTTVFPAGPVPSVMGSLYGLAADPVQPGDLHFERTDDPARLAWQHESGYEAEWWVSWEPPSRPGDQLAFLIRERAGQFEVSYIYHGPSVPSTAASSC